VGIHLVDFVLHPEKRHFIKLYRLLDVLDPVRDEASVLSGDEVAVILELPLMDRFFAQVDEGPTACSRRTGAY
jgi:hypothetical protein